MSDAPIYLNFLNVLPITISCLRNNLHLLFEYDPAGCQSHRNDL